MLSASDQQHEEEIGKLLLQNEDLPVKKNVCIIAVPTCHEQLYKHIEKEHEWLAATRRINSKKDSWGKKINTQEDINRLERLITALRTEKSEIFIDREYHSKPYAQSIPEYINDFLKTKSVNTHYTFTHFYRVTVFPPEQVKDIENYLRTVTPETDTREEYLIVPLLIRLKRGKTFEQSKMIGVDPNTGEMTIHSVNPKHFYKERQLVEEEEKENARREKLDRLIK